MANEKAVIVPGHICVHLCPKVASRSMVEAIYDRRAAVVPVEYDAGGYRWHCVRHPLDRLVSLWAYFCKGMGLNGQPQVAKLGYYLGQPFANFVDTICERHDENIHTRMQVAFAGLRVDRRCRYENLASEWTALCSRFPSVKIRKELPVIHKTNHDAWQGYYSPELRRQAEDVFAPDMALYEEAEEWDS